MVLGGLIVSTIFTVVLVPTLFSLAIDIRRMLWAGGDDGPIVDDQPDQGGFGEELFAGDGPGRSAAGESGSEWKIEGLNEPDIFTVDEDASYRER